MAAEKIDGLDDLVKKLNGLVPAMRKRVIRNALAAGGRIVRYHAKLVLKRRFKAGTSAGNPYRKRGTVGDAINVRTSKRDRRNGDVGVFVNVKPAKGENSGAKSPNDPYYWRWLEFGWTPGKGRRSTRLLRRALGRYGKPSTSIQGAGFLRSGESQFPRALQKIIPAITKWVGKVELTGKVTP